MPTSDKQKLLVLLSCRLMEQLHKEFHKNIDHQGLEYSPEQEALDHIFVLSQLDPANFHETWIQPLISTGISLEAAFDNILDSCLRPN